MGEIAPFADIGFARLPAKMLTNLRVQLLRVKIKRHLINGIGVFGFNDRLRAHIAKQTDFVLHQFIQRMFRAAQQHVGLNARLEQFLHRMLGGLGFELPRRRQPWH